MSQTAGMYADTNAVSQSAKVRLGKRKSEDRHGESSLTVMHKLEAKKRLAIELRCGEKRAYDEVNKPCRLSFLKCRRMVFCIFPYLSKTAEPN